MKKVVGIIGLGCILFLGTLLKLVVPIQSKGQEIPWNYLFQKSICYSSAPLAAVTIIVIIANIIEKFSTKDDNE